MSKGVISLCFALMLLPIAALLLWFLVAFAVGGFSLNGVMALQLTALALMIVSECLYFRYPTVAVIVSWLILTMILSKLMPWDPRGAGRVVYQFSFYLLFFVAAHLGWLAGILNRRTEKRAAPGSG
jgi:hypothetical protein